MNQIDLQNQRAVITGGAQGIGLAMVAWLCSAENSFTTGGGFDLSGGRSTY